CRWLLTIGNKHRRRSRGRRSAVSSCFVLTIRRTKENMIFAAGQGLRIAFAASGGAVCSRRRLRRSAKPSGEMCDETDLHRGCCVCGIGGVFGLVPTPAPAPQERPTRSPTKG